jgi:hypothetical protein
MDGRTFLKSNVMTEKIIKKEDVLELAFEEYKKYNPSNSDMF